MDEPEDAIVEAFFVFMALLRYLLRPCGSEEDSTVRKVKSDASVEESLKRELPLHMEESGEETRFQLSSFRFTGICWTRDPSLISYRVVLESEGIRELKEPSDSTMELLQIDEVEDPYRLQLRFRLLSLGLRLASLLVSPTTTAEEFIWSFMASRRLVRVVLDSPASERWCSNGGSLRDPLPISPKTNLLHLDMDFPIRSNPSSKVDMESIY